MYFPFRRANCDTLEKCASVVLVCICSDQETFYKYCIEVDKAVHVAATTNGPESALLTTTGSARRDTLPAITDSVLPPGYLKSPSALSASVKDGTDNNDNSSSKNFIASSSSPSKDGTGVDGATTSVGNSTFNDNQLEELSMREDGSGKGTNFTSYSRSNSVFSASESNREIYSNQNSTVGGSVTSGGSSRMTGNNTSNIIAGVSNVSQDSPATSSLSATNNAAASGSSNNASATSVSRAIVYPPVSLSAAVEDGANRSKSTSATATMVDDSVPESLRTGDDVSCWTFIQKCIPYAGSDPDKKLLVHLRDIRLYFTGDNLDRGIAAIKKSITLSRSAGTALLKKMDDGKIRNIVKVLMQIGASLSQSREYRDFLEDVLSKVANPLFESGLTLGQVQAFLIHCSVLMVAMPVSRGTGASSNATNSHHLLSAHSSRKRDWVRFMLCTRLLIQHLAS